MKPQIYAHPSYVNGYHTNHVISSAQIGKVGSVTNRTGVAVSGEDGAIRKTVQSSVVRRQPRLQCLVAQL